MVQKSKDLLNILAGEINYYSQVINYLHDKNIHLRTVRLEFDEKNYTRTDLRKFFQVTYHGLESAVFFNKNFPFREFKIRTLLYPDLKMFHHTLKKYHFMKLKVF